MVIFLSTLEAEELLGFDVLSGGVTWILSLSVVDTTTRDHGTSTLIYHRRSDVRLRDFDLTSLSDHVSVAAGEQPVTWKFTTAPRSPF